MASIWSEKKADAVAAVVASVAAADKPLSEVIDAAKATGISAKNGIKAVYAAVMDNAVVIVSGDWNDENVVIGKVVV